MGAFLISNKTDSTNDYPTQVTAVGPLGHTTVEVVSTIQYDGRRKAERDRHQVPVDKKKRKNNPVPDSFKPGYHGRKY
jgi:hypothetical protein